MKKLFITLAVMAFVTLSANAEILGGFFYGGTSTPGGGYTSAVATKQGSTKCRNMWYLVSVGDCSVRSAMKNGGIRSLAGYDVHRHNILGFQVITVTAWGN